MSDRRAPRLDMLHHDQLASMREAQRVRIENYRQQLFSLEAHQP